ncbi:energy transducer TonB [Pseudoduganella namucuonensis]|uniref:Protein TonB n=1 Tax=Pseudoduganella namucuonensis TaxID=1035707 RepID=A0A1I7JCY7_9BURK|nr:energy transducer TonB [Pseudoduganella namucuonensis]SFU83042.1 outer membrane transport energization protein TonB [Pseudoduganella namucuonensis]
MTTLTFDSISYSPRRAAVRRSARPAPRAVPQAAPQPTAAAIRADLQRPGRRNTLALATLAGATVLLHAAVIVALRNAPPAEAPPLKAEPLALEFAPPPPPPPPPPEPPKPQVAKVVPVPVRAAPPMPVVSQVTDGPATADTVQVATTPPPPAPPVAAAPPAPPPPPEPVTEPRGFAGYRNNPAPEYPAMAQDRGLQGHVILKVQVLASGKPANVLVDKSSGHKILDDAAVKAVLSWAFDPAKRGQTPIDGWVKVPLNFKLS